MSNSASLEDKFNAAVKAIQQLPNDGTFQPSNEMKLTFYGLYKQATIGPCTEPRPSIFNYVNRTKWDAWDKCRLMSKEEAMTAYINEIRKILETMPQTNDVLKLTQLIGPFYEFVDDYTEQNRPISSIKKKSHHTNHNKKTLTTFNSLVNGIGEDNNHDDHQFNHTNGLIEPLVSAGNGPAPSSSPSSSSSSISSSDVDEFYDDPSDRLPLNQNLSNDENINQNNEPISISNIPQSNHHHHHHHRHHPHVYGGQDGTNPPVHRSNRGGNQSNELHRSSYRHHGPSDGIRNSLSSIASADGGGTGGNERHPPDNNNYNKETQRAILTALTKLQRDVNNILERLNRLETSSHFLQQRDLSTPLYCSPQSNSLSRWLPLSGLRRRAIAFILLWPFFVFALIRLFLRARIIIRFRQPRH